MGSRREEWGQFKTYYLISDPKPNYAQLALSFAAPGTPWAVPFTDTKQEH